MSSAFAGNEAEADVDCAAGKRFPRSAAADGGNGLAGYACAVDVDGEHGNRLKGREVARFAGGQVELGSVSPAFDGVVLDEAFGQRDVAVRAAVTEGEDAIQRRFHDAQDGWLEEAGTQMPAGRLGDPAEIADMIAYLLSDGSGIVTGSVIDWDQTVIGESKCTTLT